MSPELKEFVDAKTKFDNQLLHLQDIENGAAMLLNPLIDFNKCSIELFLYGFINKIDELIHIHKHNAQHPSFKENLAFLKILKEKLKNSQDLLIFT